MRRYQNYGVISMADDEFEREKVTPIFQPEHEKKLNAFRNAPEYFTYWLKKLRDTCATPEPCNKARAQ